MQQVAKVGSNDREVMLCALPLIQGDPVKAVTQTAVNTRRRVERSEAKPIFGHDDDDENI